MAVAVHLLGEVGVEVDGRAVDLGSPRQRCVLAALAVDADRAVPVDRLVTRVWGVDAPRRARSTLHTYVSGLRRALAGVDGVALVRRSGGYALITDATGVVDVHRFRALRAAADADADDEQVARLLADALRLWRGQALTGVDSEWVQAERERLRLERLAVQRDLTDARLRRGLGADLVAELAARAAEHPLDEHVAGHYMLALHQAGRTADALEHHRLLRRRLVEELGTEPGAALRDLHRRILAADPTLSTAAAGTGGRPVVPAQLPGAPGRFTGRVPELAELDRALARAGDHTSPRPAGATAVISSIGGTGGIGKTWLALTWAHRNLHRFPDGQLSVDLRGFSPSEPEHAADVLADFLAALGVDRDQQPPGLDARAALFRTHTTGRRMLVLLDNAATPDQVVPLLPGGDSCTVLITSRHRLPVLLTRHGAHPVHVDVLTETEARALLTAALGGVRTPGADRAITELVGLCGGFPLALGLVAARIRTHPGLVDDIAAELREFGLDALDSDDPHTSLPAVLSWSLHRLTDQQRTVFGLLGTAPGTDTTLPAVVSLTRLSPTSARTALSALEEASLIGRRPRGRYAMHDLVRDYAAATAHELPADVRENALTRVVDFYLHTASTADRLLDPHRQVVRLDPPAPGVHPHPLPDAASALAWLEAEHPTLVATQHAAVALRRHAVVWHFARVLGLFRARRGYGRDALTSWRLALDAAAHLPDPAVLSRTHRFLGHACSQQGLHDEAVEHMERALDLAARHQDPDELANTHMALSLAWGARGDDRKALDHARHALDLFRSGDHPVREADALNMVGWCASRLGDHDTARDHCRAALALHRRHHYPVGEAETLDSLGLIAHRTGDHRQAVDHYQQALTLFRTHGDTRYVAGTLDHLGHAHAALGQHDQARAAWEEAAALYRDQGKDADADRVRGQLDDLDRPVVR
ncbi:AfsR/SARP family transcriptional regulator [Umezawaea sp.]|uniref:AfsR/SARP family transcriptional regulator n=1 Tax=Umezawaea sp. TaxID=1955258 RepID=UPI002ED0646F